MLQQLAEDIRRNPNQGIDAYLVPYNYDTEITEWFLENPDNLEIVESLLSPSPSRNLLNRAYRLLEDYGLAREVLVEIYPFANDSEALNSKLIELGLSPEQAQGLATEATALFNEAESLEILESALTLDLSYLLEDYTGTVNAWQALSNVIDDPVALRAKLSEIGVVDADIEPLMLEIEELKARGLSQEYMADWSVQTLAYSVDYYGLPDDTLGLLAQDAASVESCIADLGLDPVIYEGQMFQFERYVYDEDAPVDYEEIEDYAIEEAAEFLEDWDLSPDDYEDLMENIDDPELLESILLDYGYSEEDIEAIVEGLDESMFDAVLPDELSDEMESSLDEAYEEALLDDEDDSDTGDDSDDEDDSDTEDDSDDEDDSDTEDDSDDEDDSDTGDDSDEDDSSGDDGGE